jgi:peptidoglycan biosynthesis protein MviN/MurJ (putative lipid II flippase)
MGAALLMALALRLVWLRWRMAGLPASRHEVREPVSGLPPISIWTWAILATGVPVAIPVLARSLVSVSGDGALATFNYAWRLVELPNQFAIQLVTTLAFPAMARAHAEGRDFTVALRSALVLAWTLACASAVALHVGAQPLAQLLFGWGRMQPEHVAEVARWSAWGAWTLLPQALIAVMATVLATLNKMKSAAVAYTLALMLLWLANGREPREVMMVMTLVLILVAAAMLLSARRETLRAVAWLEMAQPALLCVLMVWLARWVHFENAWMTLVFSGLLAMVLTAAGFVTSPVLRALLRR